MIIAGSVDGNASAATLTIKYGKGEKRMKCKVYGIQEVNYTNKQNKQVLGTSFHVLHKDSRVNGECAESIFISDRLDIGDVENVKLGDTIDVTYNRYGSVDSLIVCK